jgi:thiol:disulfide interchange protein DsbD
MLVLAGCCLRSLCLEAAPHTQVRLLLVSEAAKPGGTVLAAIELRMPAPWHTYWRNPGDAGQATEIQWELPKGISAGTIEWPVPEKLVEQPITTYVYRTNVLLIVPLHVSPQATPGFKDIKASVSWMECGPLCQPASAVIGARLRVGNLDETSSDQRLIEAWQHKVPGTNSVPMASAHWEGLFSGDSRSLRIVIPNTGNLASADFYPYLNLDAEFDGATTVLRSNQSLVLRKTVHRVEIIWPAHVDGLLLLEKAKPGDTEAFTVSLPVGTEGEAPN